jgi:esterase/lipase
MLCIVISLIILSLVLVLLAGPRVKIDMRIKPPELPEDLEQYLFDTESSIPGLVPETEKKIIWAGEKGKKTDLSFIYIHGFSATRQETAPVAEKVAAAFHANLYYTRLKGHGRDGEVIAEATVGDWINDVWEAWEIGRRIGSKVIVIAVSTGAPLAAWLCTKAGDIAAIVMMSANFEPADKAARLLLFPWGNLIVKLVVGDYYQFEPRNELHAHFWTHRYRSEALLQMMATCQLGRKAALESISVPLLSLYTEHDRVVSIQALQKAFRRIGSPFKKMINIREAKDHVMSGYIISPETVEIVVREIVEFLKEANIA